MQHIDGNALAGQLADLFAFDPTMASMRCAGCGTVSMVATTMVYSDAMGAVAHCPHCDNVMVTLVEGDGRVWVRFAGAVAVEVPAG
ncbi:MAG TPA: DUF6510 family protein [Pseudolysinimonas sp.]